jgi:hypothetical protein
MMIRRARSLAFALGALGLAACEPADPIEDLDDPEEAAWSDEELSVPGFDRHRLIGDLAFTDATALDEAAIQAFLEATPYGGRSALADTISGGMRASQAIAKAAADYQINPLVILVRAQMEQSLVAKTNPTKRALDFAFGCGCPDYESCSEQWRGFHKQVDCMAGHMRDYLDDLESGGATIAGWQVGKAKKTLDPAWVTPKNRATAALYTYTPWVGGTGFGNVAHVRIWKQFASHVGYAPMGVGGCEAARFPSGLVAQTYPAPELTEAYATLLGPLGLAASEVPECFLDPQRLEDPLSGAVASIDTDVSANFTLRELVSKEPSARQALIDPAFVERLQKLRQRLGVGVTVVDAYRSPERHLGECDSSCVEPSCLATCGATLGMTLGHAAILKASTTSAKLVAAAQFAGFGTCWVDGGQLYVDTSSSLGCPANSASPSP